MIFVISGTNYHIFSPLDQHRSGNGPHHPRCPRYVINGSALSTRTSCHLPRGLLFNLLHNDFLWSHIITLSSSLTWQKHDVQRNHRKIEGWVTLPHWTVLMYSCPDTSRFLMFPVGVTFSGIPKSSSTGASLKILLSCLLEKKSQHLLTFPPTCSLNKARSLAEASWGTTDLELYS